MAGAEGEGDDWESDELGAALDEAFDEQEQEDGAGPSSQQNLEDPRQASLKARQARHEAAQEPESQADRKRKFMDAFTDSQLNRYEAFRRSSLARPKMKKLLASLLGTSAIHEKVTIAMCGITKLFVGELITEARILASDARYTGPLLPSHIHAAYQSLDRSGRVPRPTAARRVFKSL